MLLLCEPFVTAPGALTTRALQLSSLIHQVLTYTMSWQTKWVTHSEHGASLSVSNLLVYYLTCTSFGVYLAFAFISRSCQSSGQGHQDECWTQTHYCCNSISGFSCLEHGSPLLLSISAKIPSGGDLPHSRFHISDFL